MRTYSDGMKRRLVLVRALLHRTGTVYFGMTMLPLTAFMAAMMIGGMLTAQDCETNAILELRLLPRSLLWALLALAMGLAAGTVLLVALYTRPGRYLLLVLLMAGLVALSWIGIALLMGLRARHYVAGAVTAVLSGLIIFFIGGGLAPVRYATSRITWLARLFPNYYAIDPMRDLTLFQARPDNLRMVLVILAGFSLASLTLGFGGAARILRRPQP